ncbi:MAG: pilus assembly protein, partial [Actinomycetota bacterium]|nr:pilus assembly protein [Actinomycetota bacterium]
MLSTYPLDARERGAAAIEMALVLPLLVLLVFGIIEFGFIFNRYISVTHAAREGVRQLAVGVDPGTAAAQAESAVPEL